MSNLCSIQSAAWTDFNYDLMGHSFVFSYGDFSDEEGNSFFVSVQYFENTAVWFFSLVFDCDTVVFGSTPQATQYFQKYIDSKYMQKLKMHVRSLIKKAGFSCKL